MGIIILFWVEFMEDWKIVLLWSGGSGLWGVVLVFDLKIVGVDLGDLYDLGGVGDFLYIFGE